jgi:uncharacterized protein YijF (DUF1287 family)
MLSRRFLLAGGSAAAACLFSTLDGAASAGTLQAEPWSEKLIAAARSQIGVTLLYDASYTKIAYPGGDVPRFRGVCTDVIIRAYRDALETDLQRLVHEDMLRAFSAYPKTWGLTHADSNIDHRRVPNLQTFLRRRDAQLPLPADNAGYSPGDIVTQRLPGNRPHILIVSNRLNADGSRLMMIHNIGWGAREADVLLDYPITGRYRFSG